MIADVRTDNEIRTVAGLAARIWRHHFTPIIGRDQVGYMLQRFQSFEAIADQIRNEGYRYSFLLTDGAPAGALLEQVHRLRQVQARPGHGM